MSEDDVTGPGSSAGMVFKTCATCYCFQRCGGVTWTLPCFIDNSAIVASNGPYSMFMALLRMVPRPSSTQPMLVGTRSLIAITTIID